MDWNRAAERFEDEVLFARIPQRVRRLIGELEILHVACSGGADSVFALLLCQAFSKSFDGKIELRCLHFNHALRGTESDEDEAFVAQVCASLGIRCRTGRATWKKDVQRVSEADARAARLAFFEESEGSPLFIATGHHADDIAETMLMRLSRGSGLQGLAAPREVSRASRRIQFLRPLLDFSRAEIRARLRDCGAVWREDSSNASDAFYRNRLRRVVVPAWEKAADRDLSSGLARSRRLLEEDGAAIEAWADRLWHLAWNADEGCLDRARIAAAEPALQRRTLHRLATEFGFTEGLLAAVLDQVIATLADGKTPVCFDLSPALRLEMDALRIRIAKLSSEPETASWKPFFLPTGCVAFLPDGRSLRCEASEAGAAWAKSGSDDRRFALVAVSPQLVSGVGVRRRLAGDAFKPHGKSSPKKLASLFIERKVERKERDRLPVVVGSSGEIVWVPGLPPGSEHLLAPGTEAALRLTYTR